MLGRLIAWVLILASVATLGWANWRQSHALPSAVDMTPPSEQLEILGRYVVGAHAMFSRSGKAGGSAQTLVAQVEKAAQTPVDQLAAVTVGAEISGNVAALVELQKLQRTLPAQLTPTAAALRDVYTSGPGSLTSEQRAIVTEHLGWFGQLAMSYGQPATDPARQSVTKGAMRTVIAFLVAILIGLLAFTAGVVLLILFCVLLFDRTFQWNYRAAPGGGGVFLEAFAIYIAGLTAANFGAAFLPVSLRKHLTVHVALMLIPTLAAIAWPLVRGTDKKVWRYALGWHAGRGFFREIGLGLVGYLAGLPVLAIGFFISFQLIKHFHAHPSHPIEHMLGVSPALTLVVLLLASVYAPLTEETMFRGAFFHALRARHRWLLSATVSSFIFAAIHPQGLTTIPALMAIAVVFAAIREWRGTIFSSAAAHCLHNTALVVMMTMMMS